MRAMVVAVAFLVVAFLAPGGCATTGRPELEARLGELIGIPEAELVRRIGVPARVHESGGRRFLAFVELWPDIAYSPGASFGVGQFGRGGVMGMGMGYGFGSPQFIDRYCEATFELAEGRVTGFALRGSSCGWGGWPVILPP